jgi:predicted hotdog family 3-hydroxylacyl-ACP dehydratase
MSAHFPPIAELVPHAGPMCLLDRVVAHDGAETRCRADLAGRALFRDATGRVPAFVALELMAQCAAVHGGLAARARGLPPRPALFLGARRVVLAADALPPGMLEVRATHVRGESGLVALDATVSTADGRSIAAGRLNFFVADSVEALVAGGPHVG